MRPAHRAATYIALTVAAALTLTGCMADVSTESTDSPVPEASVPAPASPSPAAGAPKPAPSGEQPAPTAAPAGSLATFTFPEGRLSFQHPADWRVELFEASASPFVGTATVYDPAGRVRIAVYTGEIADVVAGSGARIVLETDPVLGLRGHAVPTPHSSFFVDRSGDGAQYRWG